MLFAEVESSRFVALDRGLRILNRYYRHWQLVDDVADLVDDTEIGLVTAPGFILLSQGNLARSFLDGEFSTLDEAAVADFALRTGLISGHFVELLLPPPKKTDGPVWLISRALQNSASEESLDLEALAMLRVNQAWRYRDAIGSGNSSGALAAVDESRVAERILGGHDACRRRIARWRIRASGAEGRTLMILDGLMLHTLHKARRRNLQ
jgi:hypothetical protein